MTVKTRFWGRVQAIRPRLILTKFAGETTPKAMGHILLIEGTRTIGDAPPAPGTFTLAIGPAILTEKRIGVGDLLRGDAYPVPEDTHDLQADLYRLGVLRVIARSGESGAGQRMRPDPPRTDPPLSTEAMEPAPRRPLNSDNLGVTGPCHTCPYGSVVAVVRLADPREYRQGQWSFVPACLGPEDCPHYRPR